MLAALAAGPVWAEGIPAPERRSGFDTMSPDIQAMQRDGMANPALLWLADGAELWGRAPAPGRPACAGCHGEAGTTMRGVAA
ncbi:MAG: sulfur oxidation c-type cytochrome SoxA, partial [Methylobacterium sp.]